jgi:hypothetical protein
MFSFLHIDKVEQGCCFVEEGFIVLWYAIRVGLQSGASFLFVLFMS